ncbi:unnamed protein product [Lactuca virosa]|uniref:Uncharacterized protein n=1 Tax=Lactuca virosa TaxID=75947 RepID=A0AAU9MAL4_9ASTR|nr:unnamed protein product [Lactuca virosa]
MTSSFYGGGCMCVCVRERERTKEKKRFRCEALYQLQLKTWGVVESGLHSQIYATVWLRHPHLLTPSSFPWNPRFFFFKRLMKMTIIGRLKKGNILKFSHDSVATKSQLNELLMSWLDHEL